MYALLQGVDVTECETENNFETCSIHSYKSTNP